MPKRNRGGQPHNPAWDDGWRRAVDLREALLAGAPLPTIPFIPVRTRPNEVAHAELVLDYSRYYGMNVSYQQNSGFYFGSALFVAAGVAADSISNASARSRAQAMAAPQWRDFQQIGVFVTNQRLVAMVDGSRWLSWDHDANVQVQPLLDHWSVVQYFENSEPLRWHGPAAPWLSVALVYLALGENHLRHHPELRPLSMIQG
ncbi:hypothetical protein [Allonocardiopsis opalescens]|uniref:Uncharacterized protein n=1 Tax=Allonocardiopsis opalescens TaxID=1144618 RepID=A0A2T0Q2R7_9ACTN|nr:hypothetical protein [Allonocardiopsis opalescens]PRX98085.1 hypothetical protein CLV72_105438 [Allonocardiopsis opalescens]